MQYEILLTKKQIAKKVKQLGKQITNDYQGQQLVMVCILKGGVFFLTDLMRQIKLSPELDFLVVSSYGDSQKSSEQVTILRDMSSSVEGKDVLIIEDIIDTGITLNYVTRFIWQRNPASVEVCALLSKPARRVRNVPVKYQGFEIDDHFVVGYGLDGAGQKDRGLPYIGYVCPEAEELNYQPVGPVVIR